MSIKTFLVTALASLMFAPVSMAAHKIGHNPGGGGGTGDTGGCYSGGKPNNAGKPPCPIIINKVSDLTFQNVVAGFTQSVITFPADAQAAVFNITAVACTRIRVEVVQPSVQMLANGTSVSDTITVTDFTFGGSLTGSGTAVTNCTTGEVQNIRIGGRASVNSSNFAPLYTGSPTIRVLYY